MNKPTLLLALLLRLALPGQAQAQALRLPSLISDHMILQQGSPLNIWGWAGPGETVHVELGLSKASAVADAKGAFKAVLPPMPAGGPFELTVSAKDSVVVHDVLIGELWLASGQSNMEFAMANSDDAAKEIPLANDPQLRLFQVDRHAATSPQEELQGSWKLCTPDTVTPFSAVAYHFAKGLRAELKRPVGVIANSWGGTPAEAWTPRASLDAVPELAARAKTMESDKNQVNTWTKGMDFEIEVKDLRFLDGDGKVLATLPKWSAERWFHTEKPGAKVDLKAGDAITRMSGNVEGGGWASLCLAPAGQGNSVDLSEAKTIEVTVKGSGSISLLLHQSGDKDWDDYGSETFDLGKDWKTLQVPMKGLKQGGWGSPKEFKPASVEDLNFAFRIPYWPELPSLCFNGEVAPLTRYAIKGVIWYQGEANAWRADEYQALLTALIRGWRAAWNIGDFPFLIVQLPNYADGGGKWAALRQAQAKTAELPNCGYVCTIDLGTAHNIHPHRKSEVGRRLLRLALAKVYGQKNEPGGPEAQELSRVSGRLFVDFKDLGSGLEMRGGGAKGFEIAGEDGIFHEATATLKGRNLELSSDAVAKPTQARYAWNDDPDLSLFSKDGLPAAPFELSIPSHTP